MYKCEAFNSATQIPLFETITLSVYCKYNYLIFCVHFNNLLISLTCLNIVLFLLVPPDHVRIRKDPEELRAGTTATLTCDASSSNPPAQLSWWREGIPVTEGITNSSKPGLHSGTYSSIQLKLNITPEIDGIVYTCQATNLALQRSVHDATTMNVLCE